MSQHKKPVEMRILDGTYKGTIHGPKMPTGFVVLPPLDNDPPDSLDGYAKAVWAKLYTPLTTAGVLTAGERELFASYCMVAGTIEKARRHMKAEGMFLPRKRKGKPSFAADTAEDESERTSKWVGVHDRAITQLRALSSLLGLTAIDRGKVAKNAAPQPAAVPATRPRSAIDKLNAG